MSTPLKLKDMPALWCAVCGRLVSGLSSNGTLTVTTCSLGHEVVIKSASLAVAAPPSPNPQLPRGGYF